MSNGLRIAKRRESQAEAWDDGCATDATRNNYIIPLLIALLNRDRKQSILDVGTGTGYIARYVDAALEYRPDWTLLDTDESRLFVAKNRSPLEMQCAFLLGDINAIDTDRATYDAVIISYTLLEAKDPEEMLLAAATCLLNDGILVIVIPDVWRDALAASTDDPTIVTRLLTAPVDVPKLDKFTGAPYPFFALRTEILISNVLRLGCILESLQTIGPHRDAYLLQFRKRPGT